MLIRTPGPSLLNERRRRKGASRPFILYLCSIQSDRYCEQFAPIFRRLVVKQPNLSRISRTLGQKIATLPEPRADLVKEPRVASLHSDSCGADLPIPRGIAILIEILAREALKMLMEEKAELPSAVTQVKTRPISIQRRRQNPRQPARRLALKLVKAGQSKIAGVTKTKSCPQQDPRQIDLV